MLGVALAQGFDSGFAFAETEDGARFDDVHVRRGDGGDFERLGEAGLVEGDL